MWQKHVSFRPLQWSNFQFVIPGHQIFKNSDHKNPIGQIRWPIFFFSSYMICTAQKLSICLYISILRFLSFQCPGMTHITNLARMPLISISYVSSNTQSTNNVMTNLASMTSGPTKVSVDERRKYHGQRSRGRPGCLRHHHWQDRLL